MSLIKGENWLVLEYITLVDAWVLIGCARNGSLKTNSETIETSVSGSGWGRTFEYAASSFSLSMDGLTNLNQTNLLSLTDLRNRLLNREKVLWRIVRTDESGNIYTSEGTYLITSVQDDGPYDNMNSYSVEAQGSGVLTEIFTETEIIGNVYRFEYTATGGETSITNVLDWQSGDTITLAGKKLLGFEVDGIGFSGVITSGSPVDKEVKFNSTTGEMSFQVPLDAGVKVFGYYRK